MEWLESPSIQELLKLAQDFAKEAQYETAKQFAQRALNLAETAHDVRWEIVSRFVLMGLVSGLGYAEEAIGHAIALLEFLYTPESLRDVEDQDELLEKILMAFPTIISSMWFTNFVEIYVKKQPEIIEKMKSLIEQGFNTLEQLEKQKLSYSLYFVRSLVQSDLNAALQDVQRAWSLWQRLPKEDQWLLEGGQLLIRLASDYQDLGQTKKAIELLSQVQQQTSDSLRIRFGAASILAILLLDEGRIKEAEQLAQRALKMSQEIESTLVTILGKIQLFETLMECGRGPDLVEEVASSIRTLRRAPEIISSYGFQSAFSYCGEVRLQQALAELGLPTTGKLPNILPRPVSSQVIKKVPKLLKKALRWFDRVNMFDQRQLVNKANLLFNLLDRFLLPQKPNIINRTLCNCYNNLVYVFYRNIEHLEELRYRLIITFVTIGCCFVALYPLSENSLDILRVPMKEQLYMLAPTEVFMVHLKLAMLGAIVVSIPMTLYQGWAIVFPRQYINKTKYALVFVVLGTIYFGIGGYFAYKMILPFGLRFLLEYGGTVVTPVISVANYISFVTRIILMFGVIFELPLIVLFLTKLRVITPVLMRKYRKHAIVGAFILGAIFTPPDVVTQVLMAGPLIVLYEASIWGCMFFSKKSSEEQHPIK